MKQEDWVKIMLDSISDQLTRAAKSSKRMATFFERKGETEKATVLRKVASQLEKAQDEVVKKTLA